MVEQDADDGDDHADADADEQVREDNGEDRHDERYELPQALGIHHLEGGRLGELVAHKEEHGGEAGQWDEVQDLWDEQEQDEEPGAVKDGAHLGGVAGLDVGRGADDDLRDGQAADEAADGVADALRDELPVGGGHAFVGVELVGGLHAEQRLEAGHDGDGHTEHPHGAVADGREIGRGDEGAPLFRLEDGQLHKLGCGQASIAPGGEVNADAGEHRSEGTREDLGEGLLLHEGLLPQDEDGDAHSGNKDGRGRDVVHRHGQLTEGVLAVGLHEFHIAFRIGVVPEGVRNLFEENDDADGGQHALDDAGREVQADDAGLEGAQGKLDEATDDHGEEEGLVGGQTVDAVEDNDGEARGGTGYTDLAAGDGGHDEASEDAGDEARERRCARSQGDAEAEGKGNEENDERCREVLLEVLEHVVGVGKGRGLQGNPAARRGPAARRQPNSGGSQILAAAREFHAPGGATRCKRWPSRATRMRSPWRKASYSEVLSFSSSGPSRSSSCPSSDSSDSISHTRMTASPSSAL